jgi:hypothetical protein
MIPECHRAGPVRAYVARDFPRDWRCLDKPLLPLRGADPTVFRDEQWWWLFLCEPNGRHDTLQLFRAPQFTGPWVEHPASPIVKGNSACARPAGRVVPWNGGWVRFTQDCFAVYGHRVRAFSIDRLNTSEYEEHEFTQSPILTGSGTGWQSRQMHHIDAHCVADGWIACVDGLTD